MTLLRDDVGGESCPECGEPYTSKQRWYQPNLVGYDAYVHEHKSACRVRADD